MAFIVRIMLAVGAAVAALFLAPESPNFPVAQGLFAVTAGAVAVIITGLICRR